MASPATGGKSLRIEPTPGRGGTLIRLSGVIDETFDRDQLVGAARGVVVVDLDDVKRITSYGVREWIGALAAFPQEYYCFARCRPAMVAQFNMVAGFGGRGELLSFYAPYACPDCHTEIEELIDLRRQHAEVRAFEPPVVNCPGCGAVAELDDLAESYFAYAAAAAPVGPPPVVEQLLSGKAEGAAPLRVEKEVDQNVTALWLSGTLDRSLHPRRLGDGLEGYVLLVTQELGEVTQEGLARLRTLLENPELALFLARVPLPLLAAFAGTKGGCGQALMVSAWLPFRCAACGAQECREVGLEQIRVALSGRELAETCGQCGGGLSPAFGEQVLELTRAIPFVAAPPEVRRYLFSRARPGATVGQAEADVAAASSGAFGRYELLRQLGTGGMAEVFLARQSGVGGFRKHVVVKRVLPHLSADDAFVRMLLQEARLAARISHPNVVQIFDVGQVGGTHFIAMEYVKGWDLNAIIRLCTRLDAPFPAELALRVISDVCAGLHAAHTSTDEEGKPQPIIHRDVSPHNVLVSGTGHVKLTDFGIARALDGNPRTPTATMKGKLSFMAPEQVSADKKAIDVRADIFPVGVMLYQCLTLEQPFRRDTDFNTFRAILHDPVPRISERRPELPPRLQAVLDRALARAPAERYGSAAELQQDLEKLLTELGRPAGAMEVGGWARELRRRGEIIGLLPPDPNFTPTGHPDVPPRPPAPRDPQDVTVTPLIKR
jgi:eukaryotic-like serine/threonine-protein kinase